MPAANPRQTWIELLRGVPADLDALFAGSDGLLARRAATARAKLLGALAPVLARALRPGEVVRFAARGYRYWLGEYYFAGWAAYHHNQTALVLTDRRLLLVQISRKGEARDLKNQVPLEELRGVKAPLLGAWRIDLADGSKLAFVGIPRGDRKRLAGLLSGAAPGPAAPRSPGRAASLEHLCPACLVVVPGQAGATLTCPSPACRIPFRDPRKAARLSALVPGLGDLYLRHHFFGALEFLGSMGMLGVALLVAMGLGARDRAGLWLGAGLAFVLIALPRLIDYRITLHMGRKGLVPLALSPAPGAQARNLPSYPAWTVLLFAAGVALTGGIGWIGAAEARSDLALRDAVVLVERGSFDEGLAAFHGLAATGGVNEERRVRFALALLEAGDLEGADEVRAGFEGTGIDADLAGRWNRAFEAEQAALGAYGEGLRALVEGDEQAAWQRLDGALVALRTARRPHFPASRGEVRLHLAAELLAPPVTAEQLARAEALLADAGAGEAPAAEAEAVRAAIRSLRGDAAGARAAAGGIAPAALPVGFQLLALEARHRAAAGDAAERAAVAKAAETFDVEALGEDEALRVESLLAPE